MTVNNNNATTYPTTPITTAAFFTSFRPLSSKSKTFTSAPLGFHTFLQMPLLWQQNSNNPSTTTTYSSIESSKRKLEQKNKKATTYTAIIQYNSQPAANNSSSAIIHQAAMYILLKSPSNVSIYLQLPKFRSLSVFLRNGHASSQLVENWLSFSNPMQQIIKRNNAKKQLQIDTSHIMMPPVLHELEGHPGVLSATPYYDIDDDDDNQQQQGQQQQLVPVNNNTTVSKLFLHLQPRQEKERTETMEIQYNHVPCMFTIVCVTYHCGGSVSLSINQVEAIDLYMNNASNCFLVKSGTANVPNKPITVHPSSPTIALLFYQQKQQRICDYAEKDPAPVVSPTAAVDETNLVVLPPDDDVEGPNLMFQVNVDVSVTFNYSQMVMEQQQAKENNASHWKKEEEEDVKRDFTSPSDQLQYMHFNETILYHQEDDESSWLFSSSEEDDYSVIEEVVEEEEVETLPTAVEKEEGQDSAAAARKALLKLAQETLVYIREGNALSSELNNLEYRLRNYCRAQDSSYY